MVSCFIISGDPRDSNFSLVDVDLLRVCHHSVYTCISIFPDVVGELYARFRPIKESDLFLFIFTRHTISVLKTYSLGASGLQEVRNLRASKKKSLDLATNDVKWHPTLPATVASGSTSGAVLVWDVSKPKGVSSQERSFKHSRTVNRVAWHPLQESWLLTGSQDGTCRLWDARCSPSASSTGLRFAINPSIDPHLRTALDAFCIPPGGLTVPSGADSVRDVSFDPFRPLTFAAACEDGTVHIYDIRAAGGGGGGGGMMGSSGHGLTAMEQRIQQPNSPLLGGKLPSLASYMADSASADVIGCPSSVIGGPPSRGGRCGPLLSFTAHVGLVMSLAWHPSQPGLFATGGRDRLVKVWALEGCEGRVRRALELKAEMMDGAVSPVMTSASAAHSHLWPSSRDSASIDRSHQQQQPAVQQLVSIQSIASVSRLAWRGAPAGGHTATAAEAYSSSICSGKATRDDASSKSDDSTPDNDDDASRPQALPTSSSSSSSPPRLYDSDFQLATCAALLDTYVTVWDIRRPYLPVALFSGHKDVATGVCWIPPLLQPTHDSATGATGISENDSERNSDSAAHFPWLLSAGKDGRLLAHAPSSATRPHSWLRTSGFALSSTHLAWCHQSIERGSYWRTEEAPSAAAEENEPMPTAAAAAEDRSIIIIPSLPSDSAAAAATAAQSEPSLTLQSRVATLLAPLCRGLNPAPPPIAVLASSALSLLHLPTLAAPAFEPPPHAFAALATRYQSEGAPPHVMCARNATVASELGLPVLAQTWKVLGILWMPLLPPPPPFVQPPAAPSNSPSAAAAAVATTEARKATSEAEQPATTALADARNPSAVVVATISTAEPDRQELSMAKISGLIMINTAASTAASITKRIRDDNTSAPTEGSTVTTVADAEATSAAAVPDFSSSVVSLLGNRAAVTSSIDGITIAVDESVREGVVASADTKAGPQVTAQQQPTDRPAKIVLHPSPPPPLGLGHVSSASGQPSDLADDTVSPYPPGYIIGLLEALAVANPRGASADAFAPTSEEEAEDDGDDVELPEGIQAKRSSTKDRQQKREPKRSGGDGDGQRQRKSQSPSKKHHQRDGAAEFATAADGQTASPTTGATSYGPKPQQQPTSTPSASASSSASPANASPAPLPSISLTDYEAASWSAARLAVATDVITWHAEAGDVQTAVTVCRVLGREVEAAVGKRRLQAWLVAYIDLLHRLQLWAPASTVMARASDEGIRRLNQLHTAVASVCASCGGDVSGRGWEAGCHGHQQQHNQSKDGGGGGAGLSINGVAVNLDDASADGDVKTAVPTCADCIPPHGSGFVVKALELQLFSEHLSNNSQPPSAVSSATALGPASASEDAAAAAVAVEVGTMQAVAPARCGGCTRPISTCSLCLLPVKGLYLWCQGCGHGGHLGHMTSWFADISTLCPTGCMHVCHLEVGGSA